MLGFNLAQDPTTIPSSEVVEVVQQATEAIDAFSNLGVFMAVLFVIAALIILFGAIVLILVWSNRNSSNISLTTLAQVSTEKSKENEALNERMRAADLRQQQYQEQFLAMMALISGKQVESVSEVTAVVEKSGDATIASVEASGKAVGEKVEGARDEVIASFEENTRFMITILQMQLENPPATLERTKRAVIAWTQGDMDKAQAVADEDVPQAADATDAGKGDEELGKVA